MSENNNNIPPESKMDLDAKKNELIRSRPEPPEEKKQEVVPPPRKKRKPNDAGPLQEEVKQSDAVPPSVQPRISPVSAALLGSSANPPLLNLNQPLLPSSNKPPPVIAPVVPLDFGSMAHINPSIVRPNKPNPTDYQRLVPQKRVVPETGLEAREQLYANPPQPKIPEESKISEQVSNVAQPEPPPPAKNLMQAISRAYKPNPAPITESIGNMLESQPQSDRSEFPNPPSQHTEIVSQQGTQAASQSGTASINQSGTQAASQSNRQEMGVPVNRQANEGFGQEVSQRPNIPPANRYNNFPQEQKEQKEQVPSTLPYSADIQGLNRSAESQPARKPVLPANVASGYNYYMHEHKQEDSSPAENIQPVLDENLAIVNPVSNRNNSGSNRVNLPNEQNAIANANQYSQGLLGLRPAKITKGLNLDETQDNLNVPETQSRIFGSLPNPNPNSNINVVSQNPNMASAQQIGNSDSTHASSYVYGSIGDVKDEEMKELPPPINRSQRQQGNSLSTQASSHIFGSIPQVNDQEMIEVPAPRNESQMIGNSDSTHASSYNYGDLPDYEVEMNQIPIRENARNDTEVIGNSLSTQASMPMNDINENPYQDLSLTMNSNKKGILPSNPNETMESKANEDINIPSSTEMYNADDFTEHDLNENDLENTGQKPIHLASSRTINYPSNSLYSGTQDFLESQEAKQEETDIPPRQLHEIDNADELPDYDPNDHADDDTYGSWKDFAASQEEKQSELQPSLEHGTQPSQSYYSQDMTDAEIKDENIADHINISDATDLTSSTFHSADEQYWNDQIENAEKEIPKLDTKKIDAENDEAETKRQEKENETKQNLIKELDSYSNTLIQGPFAGQEETQNALVPRFFNYQGPPQKMVDLFERREYTDWQISDLENLLPHVKETAIKVTALKNIVNDSRLGRIISANLNFPHFKIGIYPYSFENSANNFQLILGQLKDYFVYCAKNAEKWQKEQQSQQQIQQKQDIEMNNLDRNFDLKEQEFNYKKDKEEKESNRKVEQDKKSLIEKNRDLLRDARKRAEDTIGFIIPTEWEETFQKVEGHPVYINNYLELENMVLQKANQTDSVFESLTKLLKDLNLKDQIGKATYDYHNMLLNPIKSSRDIYDTLNQVRSSLIPNIVNDKDMKDLKNKITQQENIIPEADRAFLKAFDWENINALADFETNRKAADTYNNSLAEIMKKRISKINEFKNELKNFNTISQGLIYTTDLSNKLLDPNPNDFQTLNNYDSEINKIQYAIQEIQKTKDNLEDAPKKYQEKYDEIMKRANENDITHLNIIPSSGLSIPSRNNLNLQQNFWNEQNNNLIKSEQDLEQQIIKKKLDEITPYNKNIVELTNNINNTLPDNLKIPFEEAKTLEDAKTIQQKLETKNNEVQKERMMALIAHHNLMSQLTTDMLKTVPELSKLYNISIQDLKRYNNLSLQQRNTELQDGIKQYNQQVKKLTKDQQKMLLKAQVDEMLEKEPSNKELQILQNNVQNITDENLEVIKLQIKTENSKLKQELKSAFNKAVTAYNNIRTKNRLFPLDQRVEIPGPGPEELSQINNVAQLESIASSYDSQSDAMDLALKRQDDIQKYKHQAFLKQQELNLKHASNQLSAQTELNKHKAKLQFSKEEKEEKNQTKQEKIEAKRKTMEQYLTELNNNNVHYVGDTQIDEPGDFSKVSRAEREYLLVGDTNKKKDQIRRLDEGLRKYGPDVIDKLPSRVKALRQNMDDIQNMTNAEINIALSQEKDYIKHLDATKDDDETLKKYLDEIEVAETKIKNITGELPGRDKTNLKHITDIDNAKGIRTMQKEQFIDYTKQLSSLRSQINDIVGQINDLRKKLPVDIRKDLPYIPKGVQASSTAKTIEDALKEVQKYSDLLMETEGIVSSQNATNLDYDWYDGATGSFASLLQDPSLIYKVMKLEAKDRHSEAKDDFDKHTVTAKRASYLVNTAQKLFEETSKINILKFGTEKNKLTLKGYLDTLQHSLGTLDYSGENDIKWDEKALELSDENQHRKNASIVNLYSDKKQAQIYIMSLALDLAEGKTSWRKENLAKLFAALETSGANMNELKYSSNPGTLFKNLIDLVPPNFASADVREKLRGHLSQSLQEKNEELFRRNWAEHSQKHLLPSEQPEHLFMPTNGYNLGQQQLKVDRLKQSHPNGTLSRLDFGTGNYYPSKKKKLKENEMYVWNVKQNKKYDHRLKKELELARSSTGKHSVRGARDKTRKSLTGEIKPYLTNTNVSRATLNREIRNQKQKFLSEQYTSRQTPYHKGRAEKYARLAAIRQIRKKKQKKVPHSERKTKTEPKIKRKKKVRFKLSTSEKKTRPKKKPKRSTD